MIRYTVEWVPELALAFSLSMDGFVWMFAMLITLWDQAQDRSWAGKSTPTAQMPASSSGGSGRRG